MQSWSPPQVQPQHPPNWDYPYEQQQQTTPCRVIHSTPNRVRSTPYVKVVRERARTDTINYKFDELRRLIPHVPERMQLSKIKTLRLATTYIAHLNGLLRNDRSSGEYHLSADADLVRCCCPEDPFAWRVTDELRRRNSYDPRDAQHIERKRKPRKTNEGNQHPSPPTMSDGSPPKFDDHTHAHHHHNASLPTYHFDI